MTEDKRVSLVARAKPSIDIIRTVDGREHDCAAYSCSIVPCIKSYTAEVERLALKETLISEHIVPYTADSPAQEYQVADLRCVDESSRQILDDMGYDLETNKQWLPYEVTVYWNATTQKVEYSGYCDNIPSMKTTKFCDNDNNLKAEFTQLVPLECMFVYPFVVGKSRMLMIPKDIPCILPRPKLLQTKYSACFLKADWNKISHKRNRPVQILC
jgi:hypothetical protein